jgi:hypothetical protein
MLGESEIQDFNATITDAGFDPDDFNAVEVQDEPHAVEYAITGTVTVTRNSNGAAVTFEAGHMAPWLSEFETSLKTGMFGDP